jgi:hypothetical protein
MLSIIYCDKVIAKSRHWTSEEEHSDELWLTLEECMASEKVMEAVNRFIQMERQQLNTIEMKKSPPGEKH